MIGIVAAMDAEIHEFEKRMDLVDHTKTIAGCTLTYGKWQGKDVVLCKSGVGKAYAAMSCTILCMQGNIDSIINVGTAGGLTQDEQVLDIVISDTSPLDGPSGVGLVYNSHEKLSQSCIEAANAMQIRYHVGTIASQDLFMSRDEDFEKLMNNFPDSICSEMEAGAIGAVATQFNIPFVIVRSLSDVVHHNENPMEFSTYVSKASAQSAKLIENWLMRI
mgnify:CR=1 FL=1